MGIRELREELASPTGFAGQSTAMVGRQWKLEDATISALVAQKAAHAKSTQDMLKTRFDKTADIVTELAKALNENPTDTMLDTRYREQLANMGRAEAAWMTSLGYTPQQVISDSEVIFGMVDQMSKDKGEFAKKGTWNDTSIDLVNRMFKDRGLNLPNPDVAQALWEFRAKQYKGLGAPTTETLYPGGGKGIGRKMAAEVLGTIPDLAAAVINFPGAVYGGAKSFWTGEKEVSPYKIYDPIGGREDLRQAFGLEAQGPTTQAEAEELLGPRPLYAGSRKPHDFWGKLTGSSEDKPVITPTDQSTKMGPFAILDKFTGTDAGLIDGFLAQEDDVSPLPGIDESMIGASAVQELKALEEKANELTRDAAEFVRNLEAYMKEYGQDKAIRLMAGEWASLSDSEKKAVEKYLQRK